MNMYEFGKLDTETQKFLMCIFELQAGDLVCRNGNVDFYLSNGKIISWCRVHNTYLLSKNFDVKENGIYSDYQEDKGKIYTTVIRFKGGKDEK